LGQRKPGGPPPNTGDNTEISQSGDNKRFPSRQNATTTNKSMGVDKKAIKNKQEQNAKFKGEDYVKKRPEQEVKHSLKSAPVDQSSYDQQRDKTMESKEMEHDKSNFQGNIVVKKKSALHGKDPSEIDHTGRQSEVVDHTKYQGYRKKAFERKESTMDQLNSEGSAQYGIREEESNFSLEKRKTMRQSKERERFEYSGDLLPKISSPPASSNYEGDFDLKDKDKAQKEKQEEQFKYSGSMDLKARDQMRREKDGERATYTGDMDLEARDEMRREKDKEKANYSGDMNLEARDKMRREKDKEIGTSSGDIDMRDVMKKAREVRKKEKTISKYSGDILVKTLRERDNRIRVKAKKIANWQGDIVINKKRKGAHPSAAYRGGKIANSYKEREKYRSKMLKKYGRNPGIETPNYQKKKDDKPTYDKDEGKIWDVQKYRESKTKE